MIVHRLKDDTEIIAYMGKLSPDNDSSEAQDPPPRCNNTIDMFSNEAKNEQEREKL